MNYRLSPVVQGSNYVFDYPLNFITGVRITASQTESGDAQAVAFLTVPIEVAANQTEMGDTQLAVIAGPTAITNRMYLQEEKREMVVMADQRAMTV